MLKVVFNNIITEENKYIYFFFFFLSAVLSYTMLYNLLNFPCGVVPVSTVTADDEEDLKHFRGIYQDTTDKFFKQVVQTF